MSKEQLTRARELILQKRFDAARAILKQIDDPTARQWLAKLDTLAPAAPPAATPAAKPAAAPKAQLRAARELIVQKQFDAARQMLQQIDHPTAQQWLAKLDTLVPATPPDAAPDAAAAAPAQALDGPPRAEQEAQLIEAQRLILDSKFDAAKAILDDLTIPEAAIWRDKTQMNKFREFQSVWLDMYYYALSVDRDPEARATWRCGVCGRDAQEARQCPQRGHAACPVELRERSIRDPNRLALLLGGIHMGESRSVKPLLNGLSVEHLNHWRKHLEFQLAQLWEQDIRRPTLETAAILLHQLEETRKLAGTDMGGGMTAAPPEPEPAAPAADAAPDNKAAKSDTAMFDALKRLGKLLKDDEGDA